MRSTRETLILSGVFDLFSIGFSSPYSFRILNLLPATKPGGFFVEKPEVGSPEEKIEKS